MSFRGRRDISPACDERCHRGTNLRMASKKKEKSESKESTRPAPTEISSTADLKVFLISVRDRLEDDSAAPVHAVSAVTYALSLPGAGKLFDEESKEIARDLWLRIKRAGFQLRNPPLLFGVEGDGVAKS